MKKPVIQGVKIEKEPKVEIAEVAPEAKDAKVLIPKGWTKAEQWTASMPEHIIANNV